METPRPMKGSWALKRPDGKLYVADSPIACLRAEQAERVPAQVAVQRIMEVLVSEKEDAEPLTDQQIAEAICNAGVAASDGMYRSILVAVARAIERAHGIA